jgi:hypothetical protein
MTLERQQKEEEQRENQGKVGTMAVSECQRNLWVVNSLFWARICAFTQWFLHTLSRFKYRPFSLALVNIQLTWAESASELFWLSLSIYLSFCLSVNSSPLSQFYHNQHKSSIIFGGKGFMFIQNKSNGSLLQGIIAKW